MFARWYNDSSVSICTFQQCLHECLSSSVLSSSVPPVDPLKGPVDPLKVMFYALFLWTRGLTLKVNHVAHDNKTRREASQSET